MVKIPITLQLPLTTVKILSMMKDSLMRSKNWIVENSIINYGYEVDKFLAIEEDFRDYIELKKDLWKDDLYSEMLRFNLRQGFLLKNSVKKICQMVSSGVNDEHIKKTIGIYEKICRDSEYKKILIEIRVGLTNRQGLNLENIRNRLESIGKEGALYDNQR